MNNNLKERINQEIERKYAVARVELEERTSQLNNEINKKILRKVIHNTANYKIDRNRNLLQGKENKLLLEQNEIIKEKLKATTGVIYLDISEKLEKAKKLIEVSSKNMYFFKKKVGNEEKVYVLYGESFNNDEILLKSLRGNDSLIVKKEDILKNNSLLAVSTSNTVLPNLHLRFVNQDNVKISDLFQSESRSNDNKFKIKK